MSLAVIGGTGLMALPGLQLQRSHAVDTPYGQPSMAIEEGDCGGRPLFFLHRHGGEERRIPPHRVNYRANIRALAELGVTRVIAANAVGGISPAMRPGRLVIPDQLIDYTWGREHTFADGADGVLRHVEFANPYDEAMRRALLAAAADSGISCADGGVLGVVQGPRLETAAEVRRLARDGCDLVGMTGMPEAALAREQGLAYAAVCLVVNAAAGLEEDPISMDAIYANLKSEAALFGALLATFLASTDGGPSQDVP